jgi:hypothetical protein
MQTRLVFVVQGAASSLVYINTCRWTITLDISLLHTINVAEYFTYLWYDTTITVMRSFTEAELDFVLHDTKTDTAPGPDGLPVQFYKRFWLVLKSAVL